MLRKDWQNYVILTLALLVLILFPRKAQEALRNQFIKPILPLIHLTGHNKKLASNQKIKTYIPTPYQPLQSNSTVAQIIYRNSSQWNDFLWIDKGKDEPHITLNSPVLYQNAVIGIIDYMGKRQSRVKLITNSNLTISVRAMRGKNQYYDLISHINALCKYHCIQENTPLYSQLMQLKSQIADIEDSLYLAKGEISGLSQPLWRTSSKQLQGKGFNCNIHDPLSEARELISGTPLFSNSKKTSIIAADDLLITTGFDGLFPPGLAVAKVSSVDHVEEGAYYYSIKAVPIISQMDLLNFVEVIPPSNFESEKTTLDF